MSFYEVSFQSVIFLSIYGTIYFVMGALQFLTFRVNWGVRFAFAAMRSKIEKVPRVIRGEKLSKDMANSRNLVSTIGSLASP